MPKTVHLSLVRPQNNVFTVPMLQLCPDLKGVISMRPPHKSAVVFPPPLSFLWLMLSSVILITCFKDACCTDH